MAHPYNKLSDEEVQIIIMDSLIPNDDEMDDLGEHSITEMEVIERIDNCCRVIVASMDDPDYSDADLYRMLMPANRRIVTNINRLISKLYLSVCWNPDEERYSTLMLNDLIVPMVENHRLTAIKLIRPDDNMKVLLKLHDICV